MEREKFAKKTPKIWGKMGSFLTKKEGKSEKVGIFFVKYSVMIMLRADRKTPTLYTFDRIAEKKISFALNQ